MSKLELAFDGCAYNHACTFVTCPFLVWMDDLKFKVSSQFNSVTLKCTDIQQSFYF